MARSGTPTNEGTYRGFLVQILIVLACVIVGIPLLLAFVFILLGMTSVGIYNPPIGDVMDFIYRSATLLATVLVPLFALIAVLYGIKPIRKRIDKWLEHPKRTD